MKIDHIGYLVFDINKSVKLFESLGYEPVSKVYEDNMPGSSGTSPRNVYICFLKNGETCIELVSPIDETSDVYSTLNRQGEGPYHICYRVKELETALTELKSQGWMVMRKPTEAIAFDNAKVTFLFKKGAGTIELVESGE